MDWNNKKITNHHPSPSNKEDIGIEEQVHENVRGTHFCTQLFELKVYRDDNACKRCHL